MSHRQLPNPGGPPFRPLAGQTFMFLGEHTTPNHPGYVRVVADVLDRFRPSLHLRLISAGSRGQTVAGLSSRPLLDLLGSSRPDYVVLAVGLADAEREPVLPALTADYRRRAASPEEDEGDADTLGPLATPGPRFHGPVSDAGRAPAPASPPEPDWQRLPAFASGLEYTVRNLASAGVTCVLVTPLLVGSDLAHPLNLALKSYARAVRTVAQDLGAPLVDFERACRDLIDRAANYKQRVAVGDTKGQLNSQGEALLARTFLHAAGLLPQPGSRQHR